MRSATTAQISFRVSNRDQRRDFRVKAQVGAIPEAAPNRMKRVMLQGPPQNVTRFASLSAPFGQCMEVETLGMARSLSWKVHMRCADGHREGTKSIRRCVYRRQLDLDTLVCHEARASRCRAWSRGSCVLPAEVAATARS